jgi:signal recognition particle receptor subunit beta
MREDELRDALLLVMANKQDLPNSLSVDEVKQKLDFDKLNHIKYKTVIGISAISGNSLSECLDWIKFNYNLSKTMEPISETFEDVKKSLEKSSYFNSIINLASNYFNTEKSI